MKEMTYGMNNPIKNKTMMLTRKQAAEYLNVSISVVTDLLNRSKRPIPHVRFGRKYLIPQDMLVEWANNEVSRYCDSKTNEE